MRGRRTSPRNFRVCDMVLSTKRMLPTTLTLQQKKNAYKIKKNDCRAGVNDPSSVESHPTLRAKGFTELRNINAFLQQQYSALFDDAAL